LDVPLEEYQTLAGARLKDCLAFRTTKKVFGQERTIVVTYNENLLEGQLQGLTKNLEKTRQRLYEIQRSLRRRREGKVKGGKKPTVASVNKQVEKALSRQFMKGLFHYEVGEESGMPTLKWRTNSNALARLVERNLGKTILFTDNDDWSNEEIVLGYRAQHHIEDAFRDMKNPHYLGWSPMHHWTDQKIRVHAFSCVLGLTLTSLLARSLHQRGIDVSMTRMYELLGGIRETLVIYARKPGQRKHRTAASLSTLSDEQRTLFDALDLKRYAPS
jgi:transposase